MKFNAETGDTVAYTEEELAVILSQQAIDSAALVISVAQVKAEAGRRLAATDWYVIRQSEGGSDIPDDVLKARAGIRARSNEIEAMDPIPETYQQDHWWAS